MSESGRLSKWQGCAPTSGRKPCPWKKRLPFSNTFEAKRIMPPAFTGLQFSLIVYPQLALVACTKGRQLHGLNPGSAHFVFTFAETTCKLFLRHNSSRY